MGKLGSGAMAAAADGDLEAAALCARDLAASAATSVAGPVAASRPASGSVSSGYRLSLLENTTEVRKATDVELLTKLQEVTGRIQRELETRAAALAARQAMFERDTEAQRAMLVAREFEVMRGTDRLLKEQEAWLGARHTSEEAQVDQQTMVRILAGGVAFTSTAAVLMRREPASALALLVQKRLAARVAFSPHVSLAGSAAGLAVAAGGERSAQASPAPLGVDRKEGASLDPQQEGGAQTDSSGNSRLAASSSASVPLELVLDRDAGTVSLLLEWLRDGEPMLRGMPPSVLRRLEREAAHWGMRVLAAQCASGLGAAGAAGDDERHHAFLLSQLADAAGSAAVARVVVSEVWQWLAEAAPRRAIACAPREEVGRDEPGGASDRRPPAVLDALAAALETHRADGALARSALGCCALLGASCAPARTALHRLRPRLEAAMDRVEALALALESEPAGAEWVQAGAEAQRLRRVLRLCK